MPRIGVLRNACSDARATAALFRDVGLIDPRDFLLAPSDGPSTRIPSFEEL
jgi:hypothetical protein